MADNLMNKDHKATNDAYRQTRYRFEKVGDNRWKVKTEDPIKYTVVSALFTIDEEQKK